MADSRLARVGLRFLHSLQVKSPMMTQMCTELRVRAGTEHILAPIMHTPHAVLPRLVSFAALSEHDKVVEIGCADARILLAVAKACGAACTGFEIDATMVRAARQAVGAQGVRVRVEHADVFDCGGGLPACAAEGADALRWADVTCVFVYLVATGMAKLWPWLCERLPAGTRVVSSQYHERFLLEASLGVELEASERLSFVDERGARQPWFMHAYRTRKYGSKPPA